MHRLEANPVGFANAEVEIGVLAIAQRKLENIVGNIEKETI